MGREAGDGGERRGGGFGESNVEHSVLTLTFGATRTRELSALRTGLALPTQKFLGTHLC